MSHIQIPHGKDGWLYNLVWDTADHKHIYRNLPNNSKNEKVKILWKGWNTNEVGRLPHEIYMWFSYYFEFTGNSDYPYLD